MSGSASINPPRLHVLSRTLRGAKKLFPPSSVERLFYTFLLFTFAIDYKLMANKGYVVLSDVTHKGVPILGSQLRAKVRRCPKHTTTKDSSCEECRRRQAEFQIRPALYWQVPPADFRDVHLLHSTDPKAAETYVSDRIIAALVDMIKYFVGHQHVRSSKDLFSVTSLISSASALMVPVQLRGLSPTKWKYPFSPPPGNLVEIVEIIGRVNALRGFPDVLVRDISGVLYIFCKNCGRGFSSRTYTKLLNINRNNEPVICDQCGHLVRVDSAIGEYGFHESWLCGHDPAGVAKLFSYFVHPTVDTLHDSTYHYRFGKAIEIMLSNYGYNKASLRVPNFMDDIVVDAKKTAPGVLRDLPPGTKKESLVFATCAYIMTMIQQMNLCEDIDQKMKIARSTITNITQSSIKAEVRAAEWKGKWVRKTGERMFFVSNIVNGTLTRMIYGLFAACGGYGTKSKNIFSGIGMSFFGGSPQAFAAEMFKKDIWDLNISIPRSDSYDDYAKYLSNLNRSLVSEWIVVELDVQKWDIHMLANFLSTVARSFLYFYFISNKEDVRHECQNFVAIFCRIVECYKLKVFNCPSGMSWYAVASSMMSGDWATGFLNTACNVVSQLMCIEKIKPGFLSMPDWGKYVSWKLFGDDLLATFKRRHGDGRENDGLFTEDEISQIPKVMWEEFRFKVPPEDFKIHNNVVRFVAVKGWSFDRQVEPHEHSSWTKGCNKCRGKYYDVPQEYPTFLKFSWGLVECPRCSTSTHSCLHWVYVREGYKVLPKLFLNSVRTLTLPDLKSRIIGYLYTVGINPTIYSALKDVWNATLGMVSYSLMKMDPDLEARWGLDSKFWDTEATVTLDWIEFPTYTYILDRMVCSVGGGSGPVKDKKVFPVHYGGPKYFSWDEFAKDAILFQKGYSSQRLLQ